MDNLTEYIAEIMFYFVLALFAGYILGRAWAHFVGA